MRRALIVAMVTGVFGGVAVGAPAIASNERAPSLCLMDSPEC